jgi:hypothetical protein
VKLIKVWLSFLILLCPLTAQIPLDPDPCWVYIEPINNKTRGAALGDINNDGYLDLAITRENGYNYIFINQGGSLPNTPSYMLADSAPNWQLAFGDYDNDGDLDLAVASPALVGGRVRVYRNENGMINPNAVWEAGSKGAMWVGWGDVDNDGDLDLAAVDLFQFPCVFRNNNGILETEPFWEAGDYNIDLCGFWFDVDNDGDLDLAVGQNPESYPMRVYYNNNGILETSASWIAQPPQNCITGGLVAGDVNKDGWLDLAQATSMTEAGNNYLYMNQGGVLENVPSWISADAQSSKGLQFGDLDGNNYPDLACASSEYLVVYRNNNGSLITFPDWISNVSGEVANMVALGDIDNDGLASYVDTIQASPSKKLYYLSRFPVHKIDSIKVNSTLVPLSDYCYIKESGWFSLKDTLPAGTSIYVYYTYSPDMELVTCNYVFNNNLGIAEAKNQKPARYLLRVFPNPFGSYCTVTICGGNLWGQAPTLQIYDATGRLVKNFFRFTNCDLRPTNIVWDGTDNTGCPLPSGIYFIRLETNKLCETQKIIKLK